MRFLASMKIPEVSLSNLCTENGFVFWKISLLEKISTKFFLDLVPPCTAKPDFLLITIKSSLLSIIRFSFSFMILVDGVNLILLLAILFLNVKL